jgi:hypothetical protein
VGAGKKGGGLWAADAGCGKLKSDRLMPDLDLCCPTVNPWRNQTLLTLINTWDLFDQLAGLG